MRVVLCTHRFLPRFSGGVEIYTLRLGSALQQLGHQVHILTGEPVTKNDLSVTVKAGEYEGIPVSRLMYDYHRRSAIDRASYSDPLVTDQIRALLQELRPDIVHATSLSLLMAGTIEAAVNLDLPIIYTATDFVLTCRRGIYLTQDQNVCEIREDLGQCAACVGPHSPLEKLLTGVWQLTPRSIGQRLLPQLEAVSGKKADFVHAATSIQHRLDYLPRWRQRIDRIIAPSSHMRDMFVLNDFPPEKITISPYGVELPASGFQKTPSDHLRFGFIGRIAPLKGIHLLLEAFERLPKQAPVRLTIYGSPDVKAESYLQTLQSKIAQDKRITIAGPVDNADITQIYRDLDILVVTSIWPENSPITILEAQAHQTPVIASDVKGIADLVQHEVNGLIFTNQNSQDLAEQMSRCVSSPTLTAELANNNYLVTSIQEDAVNITTLYAKILHI